MVFRGVRANEGESMNQIDTCHKFRRRRGWNIFHLNHLHFFHASTILSVFYKLHPIVAGWFLPPVNFKKVQSNVFGLSTPRKTFNKVLSKQKIGAYVNG